MRTRTEEEQESLFRVVVVCSLFSKRISKLPQQLQDVFLADLETAIENRLRVLEKVKT